MLMLMVNVKVRPERRDEFLAAITEDAQHTTEREEGNFQFTVIQHNDDPNAFSFLEVYRDEAALDAHRQTPHFQKYRAATADVYVTDPVRVIGANVFPDDSYWTA